MKRYDKHRAGWSRMDMCVVIALVLALAIVVTKDRPPRAAATIRWQATEPTKPGDLIETVYDGGSKGWDFWGWSPHDLNGPGPAKIHFADWGGWISYKAGVDASLFGRFVFRVKLGAEKTDFLAVQVRNDSTKGPDVTVATRHRVHLPNGWDEVQIPMSELNPDDLPFDRVVIHAARPVGNDWTLLDKVGFTRRDPAEVAARLSSSNYAVGSVRDASATIRCNSRATKISPLIYGISYYAMHDDQEEQWKMGASIRRWGGNSTTRYNWRLSAWNLGVDWFFENTSTSPYTKFLDDDDRHGVMSALTVPIIGWVAGDTTSASFPISQYPNQEKFDPWNPKAGNGKTKDGRPIAPESPLRTSIAMTPDDVASWVAAIRASDRKNKKRSVHQYILDNEPSIWSTTHRDVRPVPLGYDELVQRTIQYGAAIRKADPDAVIAGPAEWGWLGYFYSGADALDGWKKADRKAHENVPLVEWYLRKLREYEAATGIRVLDVLDLHFYPQEDNVYGGGQGGSDEETNALRIRSTRGLWDPTYVDESWIKDNIRLLPRMKEWVDGNYPGRGISIGEWNFGGESNFSGALATAEALGRFGEFGVTSAYYWTFPPAGSPTIRAFLAYRNFDGRGGRFLDWALPTATEAAPKNMVSLFASRDKEGKHVVAIVLNLSPEVPVKLNIDTGECGPIASKRAFVAARGASGIIPVSGVSTPSAGSIEQFLPPYSITILDIVFANPMQGTIDK